MLRALKDAKTLKRCHIFQTLYKAKRHVSFHTPGHKIGKYDLTELSFSDNLASPSGCIALAQADIAEILNANASFILTDGSTSGVYSMLFAARAHGAQKIAAPVLSHKSFFHGCELLGLTPVLIDCYTENGIPRPVDENDVKAALASADALFITSPDYYGNIPDLRALKELCAQAKKTFLIDGAHGGHLHFVGEKYAGTYADLWVDGVHKSLPAFTQGALVSAKTETYAALLEKGVDYFRTSSPSYPIMASVEYAVKYPRNETLEREVRAYAEEEEKAVVLEDWTKLLIRAKDVRSLAKTLETQGVYAEFCDCDTLCFYLSPATSARDFARLKKRLNALLKNAENPSETGVQRIPAPLEFENKEFEWVEIERAEGRTVASPCGLFPPCLPLLVRGEVATKEKLERLSCACATFGVKEGKIAVIKEKDDER